MYIDELLKHKKEVVNMYFNIKGKAPKQED